MSTLTLAVLAILFLGLAVLFSALSISLLPLSKSELKRRAKLGNEDAKLVYPLKARGHELAVILVLGGVFGSAGFVLAIDRLLPGGGLATVLASLLATLVLALVVELLPSAYFSKRGLKFAASLAPVLHVLMDIVRPLAKPIVRFLDRTVRAQAKTTYTPEEIVSILEDRVKSGQNTSENTELGIILGALKYGDKLVEDIMIPRRKIVALESQILITTGALADLQKTGHNEIPVFVRDLDHITGVINMHELISKQRPGLRAEDASDSHVSYVQTNQQLDHVLNAFLKTGQHLMIVINDSQNTVGIVTIQDILEEIVGKKLVDVFDKFDDPKAVAELPAVERKTARGLTKKG